jgi:hypothetical protein
MSFDLERLMKSAAPAPARTLDVRQLRRRAARLTWMRFGAASLIVFVTAGTALAVWRPQSDAKQSEVAVHDPTPDRPDFTPPGGPRYEVLSGTYGDDWDSYANKQWQLLVWGDEKAHCWQLRDQPVEGNEGVSCTNLTPGQDYADDPFAGGLSFYTGSSDTEEFFFAAGVVGPTVERIEFRREGEETIAIPLVAAPSEANMPYRYYAVTLPEFEVAHMVALNGDGEELDSQRICGPACEKERRREAEALVAEYEAQPVSMRSQAAGFGLAALGEADLLNSFGTLWGYQGIAEEGGGYVLSFTVSECDAEQGRDTGHWCEPAGSSGRLVVAVEDRVWKVTGATGPMTADQRDRLEAYEEAIDAEPRPEWRHIATSLAQYGDTPKWDLGVTWVWTGDIPPPVSGYGSWCRLIVFEESAPNSGPLPQGREIPAEVRREEWSRAFGVQTGLEGVEDPGIRVHCDDPSAHFQDRE